MGGQYFNIDQRITHFARATQDLIFKPPPGCAKVRMLCFSGFIRISFQILKAVTQWSSLFPREFLPNRWLGHASSQKTLLSLPPETLCAILYHLDARNLLSAKLVCYAAIVVDLVLTHSGVSNIQQCDQVTAVLAPSLLVARITLRWSEFP